MMYKEVNSSRLLYKINGYSGGVAVAPVTSSTYSDGDKDFKAVFLKNAQKADAKKEPRDKEILLENVEYENAKIKGESVTDEAVALGAKETVELNKFNLEQSDKVENTKHAGKAHASAFLVDSSEQQMLTSCGSTSVGNVYEPEPVPDPEPNTTTPPPSDLKTKLANIDCVNTNLGVLILLFLANEVYPEQYKALNAQNLINLSLLQVQSDWLTLTAVTVKDKSEDAKDKSHDAAVDTLIGACFSMGVSFIGVCMQSWSHWSNYNTKNDRLAQETAIAYDAKTANDLYNARRENNSAWIKDQDPEKLKGFVSQQEIDRIEIERQGMSDVTDRLKVHGGSAAVGAITPGNAVKQEEKITTKIADDREKAHLGVNTAKLKDISGSKKSGAAITGPAAKMIDFFRRDGINVEAWENKTLVAEMDKHPNLPQMNVSEVRESLKTAKATSSDNSDALDNAHSIIEENMLPIGMDGQPLLFAKNSDGTKYFMLNADENDRCYLVTKERSSSEPYTWSHSVTDLGTSSKLGGWIRSRQNSASEILRYRVADPELVKVAYSNPSFTQDDPHGIQYRKGNLGRIEEIKKEQIELVDIPEWRTKAQGLYREAQENIDSGGLTSNSELNAYLDPNSTDSGSFYKIYDSDNLKPAQNALMKKCIELTKPAHLELKQIGGATLKTDLNNANRMKIKFAPSQDCRTRIQSSYKDAQKYVSDCIALDNGAQATGIITPTYPAMPGSVTGELAEYINPVAGQNGQRGAIWTELDTAGGGEIQQKLLEKSIAINKPKYSQASLGEPRLELIDSDNPNGGKKVEFSTDNQEYLTALDNEFKTTSRDSMSTPQLSMGDLDDFTTKLYRAEKLKPELERYTTTMLDQFRAPQEGGAAGTLYSKITNSKNSGRHTADQAGLWGGALLSGMAPGINGIASYFSQLKQADADNERTMLNSETQIYGSEEQITVQLMRTISGYVSTAWQNLVQTVGGLMQSAVQSSQFMR